MAMTIFSTLIKKLNIHRHEWVDTDKTEWRGYDEFAMQEWTIIKCTICGKEALGRSIQFKSILGNRK